MYACMFACVSIFTAHNFTKSYKNTSIWYREIYCIISQKQKHNCTSNGEQLHKLSYLYYKYVTVHWITQKQSDTKHRIRRELRSPQAMASQLIPWKHEALSSIPDANLHPIHQLCCPGIPRASMAGCPRWHQNGAATTTSTETRQWQRREGKKKKFNLVKAF